MDAVAPLTRRTSNQSQATSGCVTNAYANTVLHLTALSGTNLKNGAKFCEVVVNDDRGVGVVGAGHGLGTGLHPNNRARVTSTHTRTTRPE